MSIVGRGLDQLTPFEALHLARAAKVALDQTPDAILDAAVQKVLRANGEFLETNPEELAEVEMLIDLTHKFMDPYGAG